MPAAQGETRYAGSGDDAGGNSQPKGMGCMVDVSPGSAALDAHRALLWVDTHSPHGRDVDHQGVISYSPARAIVAATPDGQEDVVLAGEVHTTDDVGHVGAARYHAGALVDHAVVDLTGFIVIRITRLYELST